MRGTNNLDAYKDIRPIWEAALTNNGTIIKCDSHKQVMFLKQRLHQYRMLHRKTSFDGNISIYDDFIVTFDGLFVVIKPRATFHQLEITTLDGRPIDMQEIQRQIDVENEIRAEETLRNMGVNVDKYEKMGKLPPPPEFDPDKPLDL